jgi:hypothetical protein
MGCSPVQHGGGRWKRPSELDPPLGIPGYVAYRVWEEKVRGEG